MSDVFLKARERHEHFGHYQKTYQSLQHGLDLYSSEKYVENEDRLCALALRAGQIAAQAQTDVKMAFAWARAGRIERSLNRIEVLGEQYFYGACVLLLLWLQTHRQKRYRKINEVGSRQIR